MRKSALIAALTAAVLVVPLGVYASHQFTDVPDSHLFHNAIGWLADNDVTKGCNPPANTAFCPDDNVTRGQMAAFMKRLSEGQVVDAGMLAGADPAAYAGIAGGVAVDVAPIPASTLTVLGEIVDFEVPAAGGVLVATGNLITVSDSPDLGFVWLEVDGSGLCDGTLPDTLSGYQALAEPWQNPSTSVTVSASVGSHDVQLCTVGLGNLVTGFVGSLSVQWVENGSGATTAIASTGLNGLDHLQQAQLGFDG